MKRTVALCCFAAFVSTHGLALSRECETFEQTFARMIRDYPHIRPELEQKLGDIDQVRRFLRDNWEKADDGERAEISRICQEMTEEMRAADAKLKGR